MREYKVLLFLASFCMFGSVICAFLSTITREDETESTREESALEVLNPVYNFGRVQQGKKLNADFTLVKKAQIQFKLYRFQRTAIAPMSSWENLLLIRAKKRR